MSAEMINNHKKVVFLDVDGTMVNDRGEIPESAKEAVRRAKANGHKMVVCTGRSRLLEANYSISSKQYVENGIHMKVLSKGKPNENCVLDNDITLEDAYIYLTNS